MGHKFDALNLKNRTDKKTNKLIKKTNKHIIRLLKREIKFASNRGKYQILYLDMEYDLNMKYDLNICKPYDINTIAKYFTNLGFSVDTDYLAGYLKIKWGDQ